jgi:hypothetical protein
MLLATAGAMAARIVYGVRRIAIVSFNVLVADVKDRAALSCREYHNDLPEGMRMESRRLDW